MPVYDTIIVGMGAAGCTAAAELCKAGKKVLALEAMDRVGGRVHTVPYGDGVVELGAEWIHGTTPSRVYDLAIQNNITILPQELDFKVYRSDGSEGEKEVLNELVNFALATVEDPPEEPEPLGQYLTRRITEYIQKNHSRLLNDTDFLPQFLELMDLIINNYESSNSWNDVTTHSKYDELEGNQHLSWHRYGYKTLFDILLNKYNNGPGYPTLDLKLQKVVSKISYPQDPAEDVVVQCEDGSSYRARNVIVTVSLGVLKERYRTMFYPPLPDHKAAIIDLLTIGVMDKIVLQFPKVWWTKDETFHVFLWKEAERTSIPKEDFWVTKIFGASSLMGSEPCLTLWTSGRMAKLVETLPEEVVKRKSMELIRRFMGKTVDIPEPVGILRSNWFSNPYTRGSYSYDNVETPKYVLARTILGEPLLDSSGAPRVLFAGEATEPTHFSTVHGATNTGFREAHRLLPKGKL